MSKYVPDRFLELFNRDIYTVSIINELLGVKENTLRTWLKRYFSDLGKKSENGRVVFSFMDLLSLRVFTELVQNFSLTPDAAKTATTLCGLRHAELMEIIAKGDGDIPEQLRFSFTKINQNDFVFEPLEYEQVSKHISANFNKTLIILPVDNIFWATINRVEFIMKHAARVTPFKDEKKPMTKDEIEARYNKMKRYILIR